MERRGYVFVLGGGRVREVRVRRRARPRRNWERGCGRVAWRVVRRVVSWEGVDMVVGCCEEGRALRL